MAFGRPACEQENEYSVAESRREWPHQLQNILEADSSRSTNDSVGWHGSRNVGCKTGFCEFGPSSFYGTAMRVEVCCAGVAGTLLED